MILHLNDWISIPPCFSFLSEYTSVFVKHQAKVIEISLESPLKFSRPL